MVQDAASLTLDDPISVELERSSIQRVFWGKLRRKALTAVSSVVAALADVSQAFLIYYLTKYLKENEKSIDRQRILFFVLAAIVLEIIHYISYVFVAFFIRVDVVHAKNYLVQQIMLKILRERLDTGGSEARGKVLNMIQVDCVTMQNNAMILFNAVSLVALTTFTFTASRLLMSWSFLVYVGVYCLFMPVYILILFKVLSFEKQMLQTKDKRSTLVMSVLSNVRFIKFNVLENLYVKVVHELRKREVRLIGKILACSAVQALIVWLAPGVSSAAFIWAFFISFKFMRVEVFMSSQKLFSLINNAFQQIP